MFLYLKWDKKNSLSKKSKAITCWEYLCRKVVTIAKRLEDAGMESNQVNNIDLERSIIPADFYK